MDDSEAARRFVASLRLAGASRRGIDAKLVSRLQSLERLLRQTCAAFEQVCIEQLSLRAELALLQQRLDRIERSQDGPPHE
jgi:hypothetical protein